MSQDIDPLEVQFHLTHDCIRACVYVDHIGRLKPKAMAWLSICDMLYAEAVISWNAIFGTTSQETHWKVFTKGLVMPSEGNFTPFNMNVIVDYLKTTPEKWTDFHGAMVDLRNKRLAHFDPNVVREAFPNLTWAMRSAYLYREWLLSLLRARQQEGESIKVTDTTGSKLIEIFKTQISEICKDAT